MRDIFTKLCFKEDKKGVRALWGKTIIPNFSCFITSGSSFNSP